jgi:site-specific recombinase XerD
MEGAMMETKVELSVVAGFESHLAGGGKSERTIQAYVQDLRSFVSWSETRYAEPYSVDAFNRTDLVAYRKHLIHACQVAPSTWNRRLASLRAYSAWLQGLGVLSYDPTDSLEGMQEVELAPRWLSERDYGRFMREVEKQVLAARTDAARLLAYRDRAVIALMALAGLREGEVCSLRSDSLNLSARKGFVVVLGKGEKRRRVPLNKEARSMLEQYLAIRGEQPGPLFFGKRGEPLGERGIQRRVEALGQAAGLSVTPHDLRHTFAKRLLNSGAQLTEVSKLLGHSRLETTGRYVQPGDEDLELAVDRL